MDGMTAEPILDGTLADSVPTSTERLLELQRHALDTHTTALPTSNPLAEVGRYALAAPGKMLRGQLLLNAYRAISGDLDGALWAAAGTELGHLASLIHDDVIDRDEIRRGRESVWARFGGDAAIVSADLLIFEAYYCLSMCRGRIGSDQIVRALAITSKSCIDLCLGQALETTLVGNCAATDDLYWEVVRGKTASLFSGACESGAVLGSGTEQQIATMRAFGESLGLAFQVVDDLFTYTGRAGTIGKPLTSDVRNRRVTLPVIYALRTGNTTDAATIRSIFENGSADRDVAEEHREVIRILDRTGALRRAQDDAERLYEQASRLLSELPPSPGSDELARLATSTVHRAS
jgi:geranylgeranyl diphosphate synthase type I